jgi:hypothetical protein
MPGPDFGIGPLPDLRFTLPDLGNLFPDLGNLFPDLGNLFPDLAAPVQDGGAPETVACGGTPCAVGAQVCCSTTFGASGTCATPGVLGGCPGATSQAFDCDGPEDCPGTQTCCYVRGVGTRCTDLCIGQTVCHDVSTCGAGAKNCCPLQQNGTIGVYRTCSQSGGC